MKKFNIKMMKPLKINKNVKLFKISPKDFFRDRNQSYSLEEFARDFGSYTFAKLIKSYRLSEEKSQTQFAKFLGISQATLRDLEKGRRIPNPKRAAAIAKKLKEPASFWIQLAMQDQLNEAGLDFNVSISNKEA